MTTKILSVLTSKKYESRFRRCITYNILIYNIDPENKTTEYQTWRNGIFEIFDEMLTEMDLILKKEGLDCSLSEFVQAMVIYKKQKGEVYFVEEANWHHHNNIVSIMKPQSFLYKK